MLFLGQKFVFISENPKRAVIAVYIGGQQVNTKQLTWRLLDCCTVKQFFSYVPLAIVCKTLLQNGQETLEKRPKVRNRHVHSLVESGNCGVTGQIMLKLSKVNASTSCITLSPILVEGRKYRDILPLLYLKLDNPFIAIWPMLVNSGKLFQAPEAATMKRRVRSTIRTVIDIGDVCQRDYASCIFPHFSINAYSLCCTKMFASIAQ